MKKRPTIIFDSTLKDVLVDDDIFIVERQDDDSFNKDDSDKGKSNKGNSNKDDQNDDRNEDKNEDRNEDKNEDVVITNELKRQIVNI